MGRGAEPKPCASTLKPGATMRWAELEDGDLHALTEEASRELARRTAARQPLAA
jgi:hypothetical protein